MERAREVVLLADSSKLETRSFVASGRLDVVDVLVTDRRAADRTLRALRRRVPRVIVA
jgi:DeoR family transcriptional regulator of aga operon